MSETFNSFLQKRKCPSKYAQLFEYDIHFCQTTEDNFINRMVQCRSAHSFIFSFSCPLCL